MNLNVDLGAIEWRKLRPSRRVLSWLLAAVVLVALCAGVWRYLNHPPRPWLVRWRLNRYLAKEAQTSDFKVDFPFPSPAEMARKSPREAEDGDPKGSRTGKDFDTLRDDYFTAKTAALKVEAEISAAEAKASRATNSIPPNLQAQRSDLEAKERQIEPIVADLWELQHKLFADADSALGQASRKLVSDVSAQIGSADSYPQMYRGIGKELWVARQLLQSRNADHRRVGITLAIAAATNAVTATMNGWVAGRICEAYILPNMDVATDASRQSEFNADNLMRLCADFFRRNNEWNNVVRIYDDYIAHAPNSQRADWARIQVADAYQQAGDLKESIAYLRKIQNTNDFRVGRRITFMQRQLR